MSKPSTVQDIRVRRGEILAELQSYTKISELQKRAFTPEERERIRALRAEDDGLKAELQNLEGDAREREAIKRLGEELSQSAGRRTAPEQATPKGADLTKEAGGFKSFGEQMQAIAHACMNQKTGAPVHLDPRLQWDMFQTLTPSGMSEGAPSDGGFLVQRDFSSELIRRTYEYGELLNRVRKIPISANANGLRINAVDETSRATGSRWGGVQVYWQNEADSPAAKKPRFRQIELNLKKLIGLCYATDELLQDAAALEEVLMQGFSEEFSFMAELGIFNGTGAGQMLGFQNSGALVVVPKQTGQAAKTLVKENIDAMWARMWARSRPNAVWLINQDVEPQLDQLGYVVGTGGLPAMNPTVAEAPYRTLKGRPVIPVEYASTLGTQGDISLVDLSQYLMIDKGGMQAASSVHVRFIYDEMTFRFVWRIDGQPTWYTPLTPFNGTNSYSPYVTLAAR